MAPRHKFKNGSIKTCYNSWLQCDLYLQRMPFGLIRMFPLIVCAYSIQLKTELMLQCHNPRTSQQAITVT